MTSHHIAQADRLDAWASTQIQAALSVLLPEREADWFEDRSDAFREWLTRMSRQHLDEAQDHRKRAHTALGYGNLGFFKDHMREALHDIRMAKHYARRVA